MTQAPRRREGTELKLAATQELFAYWNRIRGARSAPERNDVEPGEIRGILADTLILDFDPQAGFPLRIAGSRTNALFLRELRGRRSWISGARTIARRSAISFKAWPTKRSHS